jgi:hypothetical protein
MLTRRPVRPNVYRPVTKLGVSGPDWPFVVLFSSAAYAIAFLLDLRVGRVQLAFPILVASFVASVAFFNWARRGRRPLWLRYQLRAALRPARLRRRLPSDPPRVDAWLVDRTTP